MLIQREKNETQFGNVAVGTVFEWQGRLYMKYNPKSDIVWNSVDLETGATLDIPNSKMVELVKATLVVG